MRQQYHIRVVGGHRLVWDVNGLIDKAASLPVVEVPLEEIAELDEAYWFGHTEVTCRQVAVHARLIEESDLAWPIILSRSGRVMDGMHRVVKALLLGRTSVSAVRFVKDPEPDYVDVDLEDLPYDDEA